MPRPIQLNPTRTAAYAADNARLPPEHQADVSLAWRERCIMILRAHMNPIADGLSIVGAGVYTGLIGWWDGVNEGKRDAVVTQWREVTAPGLGVDPSAVREPFQDVFNAQGELVHKGVKDPRRWLRCNKTVYPTLALALVGGVATTMGWMGSRYIVAPAIGGVGYLTGSMFRDMAYRSQLKKQEAAAVPVTETEQGGADNPYAGYPQVA